MWSSWFRIKQHGGVIIFVMFVLQHFIFPSGNRTHPQVTDLCLTGMIKLSDWKHHLLNLEKPYFQNEMQELWIYQSIPSFPVWQVVFINDGPRVSMWTENGIIDKVQCIWYTPHHPMKQTDFEGKIKLGWSVEPLKRSKTFSWMQIKSWHRIEFS